MSPIRPCPNCRKPTDFHEDEIERVEDGRAFCLQCGMEIAQSAFIMEMIAGEHDDLIKEKEDDEYTDDD